MAVTLDEVASASGVSRATASRALNGRDGVRPVVRERVHSTAAALGYRVNRAAKNLASGRSSVIGLVMPAVGIDNDPYSAGLIQAIANATNRHDEGLLLLLSHPEPSRAVSDTVREGLVDGLVVSTVALGQSWVDELLAADIPTVLIGAHDGLADVHTIEVDNFEATVGLVEHLYHQGCRRIGHIQGPREREDARLRDSGFRSAHHRLELALDPSLVVAGDYLPDRGRAAMVELLALGVDGVVAANDQSAKGAIRAIRDAGLSVPVDVAVAGFDGTGHAFDPPITSAVQPFEEMCELAVTTLMALVDQDPAPLHQTVPTTLRLAASSVRN